MALPKPKRPKQVVITHLAGAEVLIHDRTIQRCAICGFLLRNDTEPGEIFREGDFIDQKGDELWETEHWQKRTNWFTFGDKRNVIPPDLCIDRI